MEIMVGIMPASLKQIVLSLLIHVWKEIGITIPLCLSNYRLQPVYFVDF